ncbi:MAG: hypothetical protein HGA67_03275 [Candidatus Yonathbacteria bacterium]|nr:hypothetical protein [Candidatus Yonathbacteria bacterium]
MAIRFRFACKKDGHLYLTIDEEYSFGKAMERLVAVEFADGSHVTKMTDTVLVLRTRYMGRFEVAVFQGGVDEMKKLVALATVFSRAAKAYEETDEHERALSEKIGEAVKLMTEGVPAELAALLPVNSEGWQVLQRSLLYVFGATEEEMDLAIQCDLTHEDMCLVCEMVEEGLFPSFTAALTYAKAS